MKDEAHSINPVHRQLSWWEQWRGVFAFCGVVAGSSSLIWHSPAAHWTIPILLGLGLFHDVFSAVCYSASFIQRRHVSGLPLIGMIFYTWAWLCYPRGVLWNAGDGLGLLWISKLLDLIGLAVFHLLFHLPFSFFPYEKGRTR
jgi:hypothetical protein